MTAKAPTLVECSKCRGTTFAIFSDGKTVCSNHHCNTPLAPPLLQAERNFLMSPPLSAWIAEAFK